MTNQIINTNSYYSSSNQTINTNLQNIFFSDLQLPFCEKIIFQSNQEGFSTQWQRATQKETQKPTKWQNRTHRSGHDKMETQKPTKKPTTQVMHRAHRRAKQIERVQQQQRANGPINCPCGSYLVDSFTPGGSIIKRGAT